MLHVSLIKKDVKDFLSTKYDRVLRQLRKVTVFDAALRFHFVAFKEYIELYCISFDVFNLHKFSKFFINFLSVFGLLFDQLLYDIVYFFLDNAQLE